jgi:hypothetical protein
VRTGDNVEPFVFWDLATPRTPNRDVVVESNASISAFLDWINFGGKQVRDCGLDFDPLDDSFAVWCGGPQVWKLRPPAVNVAAGWTIDAQPISGAAAPAEGVGKGVLGKWRYAPGYDVFVALQDSYAGNIWIYKPLDWTAPKLGDAVNWAPTASLVSPAAATKLDAGSTVLLQAQASDVDGSIASVEFLADGVRVGVDTAAPYQVSWTAPDTAGQRMLWVRATDNRRAEALSAPIAVEIVDPDVTPNVAPTVAITNPADSSRHAYGTPVTLAANAQDSDGRVTKVEFVVLDESNRQSVVAIDTTAPYSFVWTIPPAGTYRLTARATDEDNAVGTSAPVTFTVEAGTPMVNVASRNSGGVASASSTFSAQLTPSAAINGDRRGVGWTTDDGWKDATQNSYPDSLQVAFAKPEAIERIDVFTLQDDYTPAVEPTPAMTFTRYGITAFQVQTWNGSSWVTVPGGSVTGNNRVWRTFTFPAITTDRIRVLVTDALAGYSRIVEVEAWANKPLPGANFALRSAGGTASASSTFSAQLTPSAAINGDRRGRGWGADSGWKDATQNSYPDSLQVAFTGAKAIERVDVFMLQDDYANAVEPTPTMTFTRYGITAFDVQTWNGSTWVTVPGGSVRANNRVWRTFTFPAIVTDRIRVLVNDALNGYSRIVEVEAWGSEPQ